MIHDTYSLECSKIQTTMNVMGGKWKPLILYLLDKIGTMRFSDLNKKIEGVTQKMLTQQLRELERDGLIKRKVYPVVPPKVEYSLTDYGATLIPILLDMEQWGLKHRELIKNSSTSSSI